MAINVMRDGSSYNTPLAHWLNKVGMTSKELARRAGYRSDSGMASFLKGNKLPTLALMYEIERVTQGQFPIEAWLSWPMVREMLAKLRLQQPEEYRPGKSTPAAPEPLTREYEEASDES